MPSPWSISRPADAPVFFLMSPEHFEASLCTLLHFDTEQFILYQTGLVLIRIIDVTLTKSVHIMSTLPIHNTILYHLQNIYLFKLKTGSANFTHAPIPLVRSHFELYAAASSTTTAMLSCCVQILKIVFRFLTLHLDFKHYVKQLCLTP